MKWVVTLEIKVDADTKQEAFEEANKMTGFLEGVLLYDAEPSEDGENE